MILLKRGISFIGVLFIIALFHHLTFFNKQEACAQDVVSLKDKQGRPVELYGESHALLIGVSDYTAGWPDLVSIPGEIERVESALKQQNFQLEKVMNPNSEKLERAFKDFINRYGYDENNRLLFFFSGHGYSRKRGKGYLVPTDAPDPRKDEKGFLVKAFSMSQIVAWCQTIEARHALFLFDSCFSFTIFKTKALREQPPHISSRTARHVRQFISAGSAGEHLPAKSVFAPLFIRALRGEADLNGDGYVTGTELGMYLYEKVAGYDTRQTPQYGKIRDPDLDEGDFVFLVGGKTKSADVKAKAEGEIEAKKLFSEEQQKGIIDAKVSLTEEQQKRIINWKLISVITVSIIFVSSLLFIIDYRRRKKKTTTETPIENEGIENIVVNDAAIGSFDQDLLGTSELAKGLSLFLSNKNTVPPITLAITGKWGSGKSSVMGMLKEYLKDARYCPIWFNAWHHYKEEHMFGALLESIRQEAVPPIWRPSGLSFRLRLLARRAWRHPLITILIISIVLFFVSFSFISGSSIPELLKVLYVSNKKLFSASIFTVLLGAIAILAKGLAAFGLNPNLLFRKMSRSFKNIGVDADPGLRYRINQYLDDITWALSKRTLVIFVDDLDRCPPDQVLRAMECANFLSSNPRRSFIVLGMALDKVLPSISGEFNYIVEEALEEKEGEREDQRNCRLKEERLAYAKNYLEKMINIEIHVPEAPVEKMEKLANPKVKLSKQHENKRDKSNRLISIIDQRVFPLLFLTFILLGIFASGYYAADKYDLWVKDSIENVKISGPGSAVPAGGEDSGSVSAGPTGVGDSGPGSAGPAGGEDSGQDFDREDSTKVKAFLDRKKLNRWIFLVALGGPLGSLLVALLIYYFISKKTVIEDDPVFVEALKLWTKIITMNNNTPRHLKRAVNQLRLLAMRMQIEGNSNNNLDQQSLRKQIIRFIVLKALRDLGIDSKEFLKFVAEESLGNHSSSVNNMEKRIKDLTTIFNHNLRFKFFNENENPSNILNALATVVIEHQVKFKGQWPTSEDAKHYNELMTSITLH